MTRLEKAKELHPDYTDERIIEDCPECLINIDIVPCIQDCEECWNVEYEEGEQI
jgi:hypothetical protein